MIYILLNDIINWVILMKSYWIYLIKQGLIDGNLEGRYIGFTDEPLSKDGAIMLKKMKEVYVYPPVEECFSSPLSRCTMTMEILYPDMEATLVPELKECNFGHFEGLTHEDLKDDFDYQDWINAESPDIAPPFGESSRDFTLRVCSAFNGIVKYMMSNGITNAAVCTHGGVISTILATYGFPQLTMSEWSCVNGKGFAIKITPSVWMREGMFEVAGLFPFEKSDEEFESE